MKQGHTMLILPENRIFRLIALEVNAGRGEFEQMMEGRIRHGNVVKLRAYYYSCGEKLLVYDCYSKGSVSNVICAILLLLLLFASHVIVMILASQVPKKTNEKYRKKLEG